ncbi:MAG: NAD(P)-dependent oxidoreductase [Bacteroidia bacterium]|nr:NAD(P)-dependent oxidoreductase [Bacteroidia bacterium]
MRILVTGANGLLGQKLSKLLDQKPGVQLIATARKPITYSLSKSKFRILDITNQNETEKIILEARPEVVIHTAAMTQVDQCETDKEACWKANVTGVENVVHACEKSDSFLVHVSTDFIFDGTHGPLDETAIPNPVNFYGESKLAGENVVMEGKLEWAILRTVLVYGITDDMSRSNIVLWVKKSLEEGKMINVVNDQWRTPTLAEDLAMGCYLAATKKAKGIFHISGEKMMTPYDIAIETADFFNLNKSLIKQTDSSKFKQPATRPLKTGFIIEKANRELGYQPHSFRDGLKIIGNQLKG